jgi:hypothetical protein
MERRSFVELSAFTALALTLPFAESCSSTSEEMAVAQPLLFSHLVDVKAISEAGSAYRKTHASEDDRQKLTQLLLSGHSNDASDKDKIQARLNEQVTADFKSGNTVIVSGWVMALTEARQCALFSILKS